MLLVPEMSRTFGACCRSQASPTWEGGSEREERHPGDALGRAEVEHRLSRPLDQAVGVLHAGDAHRKGLPELVEPDVAEADGADLALLAQGHQLGELVVEV